MTLAPYLLKLLGAILVIFTYLRLQKIPNIQQRDNYYHGICVWAIGDS